MAEEEILFAVLAAFAGVTIIFGIVLGLIIYIYQAIALITIAKKTNTPNEWLAFIPIGNIFLMTQIGKVPGWWTLGALIPAANLFVMGYLGWNIAEVRKYPKWMGLLLLLPIVNLIVWGVLAWKEPT